MRGSLKSLLLVGALSLSAAVAAPVAPAADACPNEQLRAENSSTALPDCRAYELVSPDSNHSVVDQSSGGVITDAGNTMAYSMLDAPEHAESGEAIFQWIVARRDPLTGWRGASMSPPLVGSNTSFQSFHTIGVSKDLSMSVVSTSQPLDGQPREARGYKDYIGHPGGAYRALTPIPDGGGALYDTVLGGTADFSHVYFAPNVAQLPSDPTPGGNVYSWSEEKGLRLIGILPDKTPAPGGANFVGASADGAEVVFRAEGKLYLRTDESQTVEVSASQRTVDPDPNPPPEAQPVGITPDGSTVLFTSRAELTNDANTGESSGVATDAGRDLYSYDTATGKLTDLTVDTNPADAATGADIQNEPFNAQLPLVKASADRSHVYFLANGKLAPGATSGRTSLYDSHDGQIDLVVQTEAMPTYITPDGRYSLLGSTESLTGYDNSDPVTGQPHLEYFEATLGAGLVCVTCRPDGTRPAADSAVPEGGFGETTPVSDDGQRVFFETTDAVMPQASNGLMHVFEYENGNLSAISPLNIGSNAELLVVSHSGDDAFFKVYEDLLSNPNSGPTAVIDARVDGGFPLPSHNECFLGACRGPLSSAPPLAVPASNTLSGAANLASPAPVAAIKPKPLTRAQKLARALKACKAKHNKKKRAACQKRARRTYRRSK